MRMSRVLVVSKRVPLYTVVSRNVVSVSLISCVNLIVGCIVFAFSIQRSNCSFEQLATTKISSMYRFQMSKPGRSLFSLFSISPINMLAYAGAIFVPMAVPWICR